MNNKGKLYLVPSPLGDNAPEEVIPAPVLGKLLEIRTFVVEEIRTARRYLSKAGLKGHISELEFHELNEHTPKEEIEKYISLLENGNDVAVISEAGLPAVADPGAQLVELAHKNGITVIPFVGPSSLMMALMASGMNGQTFTFCGYLPAKPEERKNRLKQIEKQSASGRQTMIFIETPYRNDALFNDILATCKQETKVCIAVNITMPDMYIKSDSVKNWKSRKIEIGKRPCVFLISSL